MAADQDWTGPLGREATVYGQVSASVVTASDGTDRRTYGADAAQSVSRIGFRASMPGSVRNFRFETGLGFRHSNQVGQMAEAPAFDLTKSDIRWLQLSWALPRGQTFSLGQGSMATDNVATSDLSGTDVVTGVSVPDMAGRFQFRTRSGLLSGITLKSAFRTYDGIRRVRARYDRRLGGGLVLSVAAGAGYLQDIFTDEVYDIALTYSGDQGDYRLVAALGASMTRETGLGTVYETVGSASVLHRPSGWNVTISGGAANPGGPGVYVKLGRRLDWLPWGRTALSVDVLFNHDTVSDGSVSRAWGAAVVQHLDGRNVDLFLGLRGYDLRNTVLGDLRPVRAAQLGVRWRF